MQVQWFCKLDGIEQGPLTTQQLVALVKSQKLRATDPVRRQDTNWVPAGNVKGLFPAEKSGNQSKGAGPEVTADVGDLATSAPPSADALPGVRSGTAKTSPAESRGGPAIGSTLGNYKILELLGEGGMGVVLKAQHIRMERLVALKVLRGQATQTPGAVKRFQQEVRAAAKLVHSNIVTAYDADEVGGVHFLVMEYVNGTNLAELLVQRGKFSVSEAVDYVIQTARGLGYAHGEGVIHRDIKPGNLLLDKRGVVKILDMGLASIQQTQDSEDAPTQHDVTQANQLLGTFDYMPPEQAEDPHSVDQRADVYSLGCTLYRLLTGQLPYRGDSAIKKILAHRDHPIPSILALRSDVPAEIDRIFHKMVAKRPEDRYQSMAAVIDDLEKAVRPREGFIPGTGQSEKIDSGRESSTWSLGSERDEFRLEPVGGRLRSSEEVTREPTASDSDDEFGFQLAPPMDEDRYYWQCMGQEVGPFTLRQLRGKKLNPDDLVRSENSRQWLRASEIKGLF